MRRSTRVLVRVDLATGDRTVIADEPEADLWSPAISPDGTAVAYIRESYSTPERAPRISLRYLRFGDGPSELAADWDRWPASVTWSRDGDALIVTADEDGRCPVFRIGLADGEVDAADLRRLRLHRCDSRARTASSTRCAVRTRRRRTRCASIPTAPSPSCRASSRPSCPAR